MPDARGCRLCVATSGAKDARGDDQLWRSGEGGRPGCSGSCEAGTDEPFWKLITREVLGLLKCVAKKLSQCCYVGVGAPPCCAVERRDDVRH